MSVHDSPSQISLLNGKAARYCSDANIFYDFWIPGRKFDITIYSKLWDHLSEQISSGYITSTEEVYRELKDFTNPAFQTWLSRYKDHLYKEDDEAVIKLALEIIGKHTEILFRKDKKNGADAFLVATAKIYGLIVITEELPVSARDLQNSACPKIPNLCDELGVKSINFLGYCGAENITLGPT